MERAKAATSSPRVLRISSDGNDRRIFGGLKFSIFGGRKIWQVFFFLGGGGWGGGVA